MKQLLLMIGLTLVGTVGVFTAGPFWGVAVYYLFAVLRPQFLWQWSLPPDIPWSFFVAAAAIGGAVLTALGRAKDDSTRRWTAPQRLIVVFAGWMILAYLTARNSAVAYPTLIEYLKIFAMFITATIVVRTLGEMWLLYGIAAFALGYIAYDINAMYLFQGYLSIYHRGYGGLDNNGAGLMLAMGVPLCLYAWEGTRGAMRWVFLGLVPLLVHAVLMSYSRGAMVSLLAVVPLLVWRSRQRGLMLIGTAVLAAVLPIMAGAEIRARFFTLERYEAQNSAQSRFASWNAAWQIASDHPIAGVGLRNANLLSQQYGADMENRTIHSQYLQIAADTGFVGVGIYLMLLASVWIGVRRVRRQTRGRTDDDGIRAHAIASGVETSMVVFCVGALFLSLEVFELPYLLLLLGAQLPAIALAPADVRAEAPTRRPVTIDLQPLPAGTALPNARARYWARRGGHA